MYEIKPLGDGLVVRVRLAGAFVTPELRRLRTELFARQSALRLLFDWTGLESWDRKQPIGAASRDWEEPARLIVRAAIVHNQKWNRQAAAFSAILRIHQSDVRSWPPENAERAMRWLVEPGPSN